LDERPVLGGELILSKGFLAAPSEPS